LNKTTFSFFSIKLNLKRAHCLKKPILLFYLIFPLIALAQQESYYSLYRYNMNVINPAYAGAEANNLLSLTSRQQWNSLVDAPSTLAFSFSSARKNNVGLGISVVSDKVFIEQQTFAYVDFSYKLNISDNTQLYLGLKGGGNFYKADPSALNTYDPFIDPTKNAISKFNPNVGLGAYLSAPNYWLSFSIPRLFNSKRDDSNIVITAKDRVHTYLAGGINININNDFLLKPSLMFRNIKGIPITSDLTTMVSWKNNFDIGFSWRSNSSMSLMAIISLGVFDIGYAYETPTDGGLSQLNLKTHELIFRIRLNEREQAEEIEPTPAIE